MESPLLEKSTITCELKKTMIKNARSHGKASKNRDFSFKDLAGEELCECCHLPIIDQKFNITCESSRFIIFGIGIPQFFEIIKFTGFLLLLAAICVCIPYSVDNFLQSKDENIFFFYKLYPVKSSNHELQSTIVLIFSGVIGFSLISMKVLIYKEHQLQKMMKNSASQYTVVISNIPKTSKKDLEAFFNSKVQNKDLKIAEISYVYPMSLFMKNMKKLQEINSELPKRNKEPSKFKCWKKSTFQLINEKEELEEWKMMFSKSENLEKLEKSVVFVTFENRKSRDEVLAYWRKSVLTKIFYSFSYVFPCFYKSTRFSFQGKILRVSHAPEPTDIIWHNIGVNKLKAMLKKIIILIISKFVITFASVIIIICRDDISRVTGDSQTIIGIPFSIIYSIFIVVTNLIVSLIIRLLLINYECPATHTLRTISIFYKEAVATTLNTIFLIFFYTRYDEKFLTNESKFSQVIFNVIILETFLTPLGVFFDLPYLLQKFKRWRIKRSDNIGTQQEVNEAWVNPPMDISDRQVVYVRVFALALFACRLYPLVLFHAIFPLITNYWTDKYLFIRRHSRLPELGKKLSRATLNFMSFSLFLYNAISIYFYYRAVHEDANELRIIEYFKFEDSLNNLILFVVFFAFYKIFFKCLFLKKKIVDRQDDSFLKEKKLMPTDYCRSNPVIAKQSWKEMLTEIKKENGRNSKQFKDLKIYQEVQMRTIGEYIDRPDDGNRRFTSFF